MGAMPGHVGKGPLLQRIDEFSRDKNRKTDFENARNDLADGKSLIHMGVTYLGLTTPEETHVEGLWFKNWWPQHQPTEPVAREGLRKAFDLAIGSGFDPASGWRKPLDCFWVCTGGVFQTIVTESPSQVNVLVLTPPPPISLYEHEMKDPADIWVSKHASAGHNPKGETLETSNDPWILLTRLLTGPHS